MRRFPLFWFGLGLAGAVLTATGMGGRNATAADPREYVPGEVLVTYRPGVDAARAQRARGAVRGQRARGLRRKRAELLRLQNGASVAAAIAQLRKDPAVLGAQPNYVYRLRDTTANDPFFTDLWGLHNAGDFGGVVNADIGARLAWDLTTGSSNVVVGIIDTGVEYTHPDLAANIWTNPGEIPANNIDDDGNGYIDDVHGWNAYDQNGDPNDDNGHGTHVAGTIGAVGNNSIGVAGVNWNVTIVPTKFISAGGTGTTLGAVECLEYLHALKDGGLNIVASNNSWGGGGFDPALDDAIADSNTRDILFIAAAGNGDRRGRPQNNDLITDYPSGYDHPNVISVAATDRYDRIASWSNYGATTVDLGAPGVDILSTYMGGDYDTISGTSMATPHVVGAAALLKAHSPALSGAQIKDQLLNSGDLNVDLLGKTLSGRRLNVNNALSGIQPTSLPSLTVSASTKKLQYRAGNKVPIAVRVTQSGVPVDGVPLRLVVKNAIGTQVLVANGVTSGAGTASFNYKASKTSGKGLYQGSVTIAKAGYDLGTGAVAFTIK